MPDFPKAISSSSGKPRNWVVPLGTALVAAVGLTTCTQGVRLNAERDVRLATRGDPMHTGVEVVLPDLDGKFRRRSANDPAVRKLHDAPRLPDGQGVAGGSDGFDAHWQARTLQNGVQEIRVIWDNGDRGYDYVYRNENGRLVPVSSRASHAGYMFDALPWAFGAMLATGGLYGMLVWYLRRREIRRATTE